MSIFKDINNSLKGNQGALFRLIIINIIVFILANILVSSLVLNNVDPKKAYQQVSEYTNLPAEPDQIIPHIWTFVSYMFVHFGFLHLFTNMLTLYFMGRIFCDFLGGAKLTLVYILGGLTGGIVFVLANNFIFHFPNASLEGASAGVMAVFIAMAAFQPDMVVQFLFNFRIKLKWLGLIFFVLFTLFEISSNTGGKVAHAGGAAFGLLYGTQMRTRKKFLEGFSNLFKFNKTKLRVAHTRSEKISDEFYNTNKSAIRKRVDEILDKISRSGYDSLSRDEKDFLQKNHDKF